VVKTEDFGVGTFVGYLFIYFFFFFVDQRYNATVGTLKKLDESSEPIPARTPTAKGNLDKSSGVSPKL
jgi:hypothetical protein